MKVKKKKKKVMMLIDCYIEGCLCTVCILYSMNKYHTTQNFLEYRVFNAFTEIYSILNKTNEILKRMNSIRLVCFCTCVYKE